MDIQQESKNGQNASGTFNNNNNHAIATAAEQEESPTTTDERVSILIGMD
jgi:hypothetical protein